MTSVQNTEQVYNIFRQTLAYTVGLIPAVYTLKGCRNNCGKVT